MYRYAFVVVWGHRCILLCQPQVDIHDCHASKTLSCSHWDVGLEKFLNFLVLLLFRFKQAVADWKVGRVVFLACCIVFLNESIEFFTMAWCHVKMTESICNDVAFTLDVSQFRAKLFKNESPMHDSLGIEVGVGEILVIGVNHNLHT
jgi:hypothetical protein